MSAAKSFVVRNCLKRCLKEEPSHRSRRFIKLDRNTGSGDAPKRGPANIGAVDAIHFEIETDNRVGLIFLGLADQGAQGRQPINVDGGCVGSAPTRRRLDATDCMMATAAGEYIRATDLHDFYRLLFLAPTRFTSNTQVPHAYASTMRVREHFFGG
jgi:hypothetical protein